MLGVGWTEMLVIGVVALIVIGPKELPGLMQKLGKFAGTIRRMGQDFQRELNKTTGLDEVKNLRASITAPLKATTDAIRKEFNTTTPSGQVQPSGVLKPADPKVESVVDEIKAAAGMKPLPLTAAAAAAAAAPAPTATDSMKDAVSKRMAEIEAAKTAAAAPKPARVKAPTKTAAATPAEPKATPKKATAAKKAVASPAPVEAIAPAKPKTPAVKKAAAEATPVTEVKAPAKRKPAVKKAATPASKPSAKA